MVLGIHSSNTFPHKFQIDILILFRQVEKKMSLDSLPFLTLFAAAKIMKQIKFVTPLQYSLAPLFFTLVVIPSANLHVPSQSLSLGPNKGCFQVKRPKACTLRYIYMLKIFASCRHLNESTNLWDRQWNCPIRLKSIMCSNFCHSFVIFLECVSI